MFEHKLGLISLVFFQKTAHWQGENDARKHAVLDARILTQGLKHYTALTGNRSIKTNYRIVFRTETPEI